MQLITFRPWAPLLLTDLTLLWLLQRLLGALFPLGLLGLWLEGVFRMGVLWGVLSLLGDCGKIRELLPVLCLSTPLFLSLRTLVPGALSAPPVLLASAPWAWLLVAYGGAGLAWAVWKMLSPSEAPSSAQEKEQGQENKAMMGRLLRLSWPDLPFLAAAFFFLTTAVIGEMFIPHYTGRVIDILGQDFDPDAFVTAIFFMCLFSLGSSLSAGFRGGFFMLVLSRINLRIRRLLFSSLLHQDLTFFQETKTGELNSRLSSDTNLMSRWLPLNANVFLRSLVKVVGLYGFMFSLSPRLAVLSLLEVPLSMATEKIYNARHQTVLQQIQDAVAKAGQVVREAVGSLKTVRSFGAEEDEAQRYEEALEHKRQLEWRRDWERAAYLLLRRVLQLGMQVLMLNCGLRQILSGELSRGGLVSFLLYQGNVGRSVQTLVYICGDMVSNVGAAEKVFHYLDREPQMPRPGVLAPPSLRGLVEFQDVFFAYPMQPNKPVLKGVTFTLYPGKVTALVGPNGAGKSSVAALLQNLYQPTRGQLLLDGEPLPQYEHKYLHSQVSVVGQEPVLFSGSVRDNIAYGLESCRDAEVMAAVRAAGADGFINNMEHGLDTAVGEKGSQVSAGQKQCLAIARALVRNPRVLILDEATSALDTECEQALQESMLQGHRTVLVIAHSLQTVQAADHILVLEQGKLVEQGTHTQLMAQRGLYHHLVQRQFEA
ncbi:antigen peptide transporter 2-like isoform X2 [Monodelphis domestica]|uniref:antigen peptide transporter 2-like isoform X1 n=1 Tax=Monodelphis domestica TaxID=13616 RepID=UPI0024E24E43|nr:antigen peptide transporter 2-like isoform X1 [Monodelphis domestica]XP_056673949.1 antigen peptide transporter 2-like isoform X1 [Monodelphis domestica]XP_056673950.1 antigen peptide transporter 2-like isoform X2 [Monodelphis domestica]